MSFFLPGTTYSGKQDHLPARPRPTGPSLRASAASSSWAISPSVRGQKRHHPRHENANLPFFQFVSGRWTRPARPSERHCLLFSAPKLMRASTARDALRPLMHPRQIKMPVTDRNDCCVAAAAFGAGGKFGAADDIALQRCANVATTGFCVLLSSLAERCYSN